VLGRAPPALRGRGGIPAGRVKGPGTPIRISVGIEDVEDLWRDLSRALDHA